MDTVDLCLLDQAWRCLLVDMFCIRTGAQSMSTWRRRRQTRGGHKHAHVASALPKRSDASSMRSSAILQPNARPAVQLRAMHRNTPAACNGVTAVLHGVETIKHHARQGNGGTRRHCLESRGRMGRPHGVATSLGERQSLSQQIFKRRQLQEAGVVFCQAGSALCAYKHAGQAYAQDVPSTHTQKASRFAQGLLRAEGSLALHGQCRAMLPKRRSCIPVPICRAPPHTHPHWHAMACHGSNGAAQFR